jgi:hypothetical protein
VGGPGSPTTCETGRPNSRRTRCGRSCFTHRESPKGLHGAGIPDFPVDLGPQLAEEGDGSFELALGYFVSSALRPPEMFMGGRGRDDDLNFGGGFCASLSPCSFGFRE